MKFTMHLGEALLDEARRVAKHEGRSLQALVEEALIDLIERHSESGPRPHIMAHYRRSFGKFGTLYMRLAK